MADIFISYRRSDGGWGGLLAGRLEEVFGADAVFRDVEDIDLGEDFWDRIRGTIEECSAFLLVIGPSWLDGEPGQRRIDSEDDWLRREIRLALETDVPVLPVLFGGARMPGQTELPGDIAALSRRNALEVSEERQDYDFGRLVDRLRELLGPGPEDTSIDSVTAMVGGMQYEYFDLLEPEPEAALAKAREALALIDRFLPVYPDHAQLRILQGYFLKNEAMALRRLNRGEEARRALDDAERIFRNAVEENERDAAAWNGLGSVYAVRDGLEDLRQALEYIDRALAIVPGYEAALGDRARVVGRIEELERS